YRAGASTPTSSVLELALASLPPAAPTKTSQIHTTLQNLDSAPRSNQASRTLKALPTHVVPDVFSAASSRRFRRTIQPSELHPPGACFRVRRVGRFSKPRVSTVLPSERALPPQPSLSPYLSHAILA
ncbi:unnamed protein product, partial [Ectocarpus sp. 8 AP-2014]